MAFGVSFARYIKIYVSIYSAGIDYHITTFNEKTMQRLITFYITIMHYNNFKIKKYIQNVLYLEISTISIVRGSNMKKMHASFLVGFGAAN